MRQVITILAFTAMAISGLMWFGSQNLPATGGWPVLAAEEKVLKVDDFEGAGPNIGMQWMTEHDDHNLGTKVEEFDVQKGGSPKSPKGHALFKGHIGKQKDPWPWAALSIYVDQDNPLDLSDYKAVRFYARGDGKTYRVILPKKAASSDYCDYEFKFEAPKEWKLITASFDKFTQPDWGKKVPRDFKDVYGIKFSCTGDDVDFELHMDDVEFVGTK